MQNERLALIVDASKRGREGMKKRASTLFESPNDHASAVATFVVIWAASAARRGIYLRTINDPDDLPFYHWKDKNAYCVSFQRDELEQAIEWTTQALLAGYGITWSFRKDGGGSAGVYFIDEDIYEKAAIGIPFFCKHLRKFKLAADMVPSFAILEKVLREEGAIEKLDEMEDFQDRADWWRIRNGVLLPSISDL